VYKRSSTKFATKLLLYIPPYLKDVGALPCEIVMFQKLHHIVLLIKSY